MSKMNLKPDYISYNFTFQDESGYRFVVSSSGSDEFGWGASLDFSSGTFTSAEDAVKGLKPAVEYFLKLLNEMIIEK